MIKFCSYNPTSNFSIYLWNGVSLCGQSLNNHHTRLSQPCKVVNILHEMPQSSDNLVTTLKFPYGQQNLQNA